MINDKITFYFIRHGETDQNKAKKIQGRHDFPLNDTGRAQALAAGEYLKKNNCEFDIIYSSPLSRAFETANIISNTINYKGEIIKEFSFIERDFGVAEGLPVSKESFIKVLDDSYENMEKSYEIQKRVYNYVQYIIRNTNYKKILVVAHSHTIKALLTYLDKNRTFYDSMVNCAVNTFIYENNQLKIDQVNIDPFK